MKKNSMARPIATSIEQSKILCTKTMSHISKYVLFFVYLMFFFKMEKYYILCNNYSLVTGLICLICYLFIFILPLPMEIRDVRHQQVYVVL